MTELSNEVFLPPPDFARRARVRSMDEYQQAYARSVEEPEAFWAEVADRVSWDRPFTSVLEHDFARADVRWFEGGRLNVTRSALDRHVEAGHGDRTAIVWEGDDASEQRRISYRELLSATCRAAGALRALGVAKGDRVCIYLPMIPELAIAMLACARLGAVHNVVFGGFSADSLRGRIEDSGCKILITADEGVRGGKRVPLLKTSHAAIDGVDAIERVLVVRRTGGGPALGARDLLWDDAIAAAGPTDSLEPESMAAEDPLFILYTSGSTGRPKGVLHTTAGYLVYASYTHETVFDHRAGEDVYWCTADCGWITGHSYVVYGPLANGATTLMFEGVPNHPDVGRFWDVVDRHGVTIFYTAPTALRALMRHGDEPVTKRSRGTLRLLGTVGEPINPDVWRWYHQVVGDGRCPVVDTWWQTETGGILISPLPGATPLLPGSATKPFFGIRPSIVDDEGRVLEGDGVSGNLCIDFPWPGMMRTVYGDHARFRDTYFTRFPGRYFTGDGCRRDEDGNYWITGRVDDVLNVSGHRLGTAEIESAIVHHPAVSEAAVVGYPHDLKGQGIYAFVTLRADVRGEASLRDEISGVVREVIGPIATPDVIHFTSAFPKTRSGKIMRRILRQVAAGEVDPAGFGDTSTLADPEVVEQLVAERRAR